MNEWNDPSVKSPTEGETVEIREPGGRTIRPVVFADSRFWKVRKGAGGQAYTVEAWRGLEIRPEARKARGVDGTD